MGSDERVRPYAVQVECLAENMFFEARSEGSLGMKLVADNVFKRLSIRYRGADTVCDVITFPGQYSWLWDDVPDVVLYEEMSIMWQAYRTAEQYILDYASGEYEYEQLGECLDGATHYHKNTIVPYWVPSMKKVCGAYKQHIFYVGN